MLPGTEEVCVPFALHRQMHRHIFQRNEALFIDCPGLDGIDDLLSGSSSGTTWEGSKAAEVRLLDCQYNVPACWRART